MVAPDSNRSATARSITTRSPLWVEEMEFDDGDIGFATDGTPVDCVRFADLGLLGEKPDLIVSGINHGSNLGDDVTYSGTVAAAFEGIVLGVPSIALSQQSAKGEMGFAPGRSFDFGFAAALAARLVEKIRAEPMPEGTLLNVNVPAGEPQGVEVTRLGKRLYDDEMKLVEEDENGRRRYRIYGFEPSFQGRAGNGPGRTCPRQGRADADPLRPHPPRRAGRNGGVGHPGSDGRGGKGRAPGMSADPAERADELRSQLEYHNERYYVKDDPEIGDDEYDALIDELRALEAEHPELETPESPTQRVGGTPLSRFEQVEHPEPMLSLANARSEEDMRAWENRIANLLKRFDITAAETSYVTEPKIDGLAISLIYERRQAGPRCNPWRRPDRRGRDPQPPDHRRHPPRDSRRARDDRGPRRDLLPALGLRQDERGASRGRRVHLCQPAKRRRGNDPPARPQDRRFPAIGDVVLRHRHPQGRRAQDPPRRDRVAQGARLCRRGRDRAA